MYPRIGDDTHRFGFSRYPIGLEWDRVMRIVRMAKGKTNRRRGHETKRSDEMWHENTCKQNSRDRRLANAIRVHVQCVRFTGLFW